MLPWNDWYHVSANTYATWLPGDPRGWKTRRTRVHTHHDDSPESTAFLHKHAHRARTRPPVTLTPAARHLALETFIAALHFHHIELIACAIDDHHAHTLARFSDHMPRHWIGIAKKESARALSRANLAKPGGVWAARCHCKPICDRKHQLRVFRYIAAHATRGAALWLITDQPPEPRD